jgi:hypothetical protein
MPGPLPYDLPCSYRLKRDAEAQREDGTEASVRLRRGGNHDAAGGWLDVKIRDPRSSIGKALPECHAGVGCLRCNNEHDSGAAC